MIKLGAIIESGGVPYESNEISVQHSVNELPMASISLVPRSKDEALELSDFGNMLFKEFKVSILLDDNEVLAFSGSNIGTQPLSHTNQESLRINLAGGLYRLNQMTPTALGIQSLCGANDKNRLQFSEVTTILKTAMSGNDFKSSDILNQFKRIHDLISEHIINSLNNIFGSSHAPFNSSVAKALKNLYNFHVNKNQTVLDEEYKKIIKIGLAGEQASQISYSIPPEAIRDLCFNMGATYWSLLIYFCERYLLGIGSYSDRIYAFPLLPLGDITMGIDPTDIVGISIQPLPLTVYTRCYINPLVMGSVMEGNSSMLALTPGCYPELKNADVATTLEKKIGAIRVLHYNGEETEQSLRGFFREKSRTSSEIQEFMTLLAKTGLFKEMFKYRYGTLSTRYLPNIIVGSVISFEDPFFKKYYQGWVSKVTHNFNSYSANTEISMQYVIENSEKNYLEIDNLLGYNPLYPNYRNKDLLKII